MLKIEKRGRSQAKSRNRIKIFNYIWEKGPVSRTDISKNLKISAPSVTRIVESLINNKFVKEVGPIETIIGRKPVELEINKDAGYTIGISITKSKIYIAVVNLGREVIYQESKKLFVQDASQFLHTIESSIIDLLAVTKLKKEKILGIGIATTGVVDFQKGIIDIWNAQKRITKIPVKKYLEDRLGLMVKVDNNINVILFGEYWFANKLEGEKNQDLLCLYCAEGIGSSIIINGQIVRGHNNIAGKIAHMTIEYNGNRCICGQRGCLEAYTSISSIEEEYRHLTSQASQFTKICDEANHNHPISKKVIESALTKIAIAVNNINVMLNPEVIMVSGDIFDLYNDALNYLKLQVENISFSEKLNDVQWKKKTKTEFMIEYNATALIYDEILRID